MDKSNIISLFKDSKLQESFVSAISDNKNIYAKGLVGSALSFTTADSFSKLGKTHVLVCNDKEEAAYHLNDLEAILGKENLLFYPGSYRRPYQIEEVDNANVLQRAEVLNRVNNKKKPLFLVTYPNFFLANIRIDKQFLFS